MLGPCSSNTLHGKSFRPSAPHFEQYRLPLRHLISSHLISSSSFDCRSRCRSLTKQRVKVYWRPETLLQGLFDSKSLLFPAGSIELTKSAVYFEKLSSAAILECAWTTHEVYHVTQGPNVNIILFPKLLHQGTCVE